MERTGDLCEIQGETTVQWKIRDFFSHSNAADKCYRSPTFYFSGTSWEIKVYPNGQTNRGTVGYIDILLHKDLTGNPITVDCSVSFGTIDGKILIHKYGKDFLFDTSKSIGWQKITLPEEMKKIKRKFIHRSGMEEKMGRLVSSNELIVICTLKNKAPNAIGGSLLSRYQKVVDNLKEIYFEGKKTDFILKVDGQTIGAHRIILETRSPVFAAMLRHDTKENQTGEVSIDDVDYKTMVNLLRYMYSGEVGKLTCENVLPLYAAAEKYDIKEIRDICSEFIKRIFSVAWLCDVLKFVELYQNEAITHSCRIYFTENTEEIIQNGHWKKLAEENPEITKKFVHSVFRFLEKKKKRKEFYNMKKNRKIRNSL